MNQVPWEVSVKGAFKILLVNYCLENFLAITEPTLEMEEYRQFQFTSPKMLSFKGNINVRVSHMKSNIFVFADGVNPLTPVDARNIYSNGWNLISDDSGTKFGSLKVSVLYLYPFISSWKNDFQLMKDLFMIRDLESGTKELGVTLPLLIKSPK